MPVNLGYFLFFYVFIYMSNAVYGTFIPLYFQDVGFTQSQIGTLLSLGPLVAVLAQPVWGTFSDRARTKNGILLLLIGGTTVSVLLYPLSDQFAYLLVMISLFTFFQTSIFAVGDAITLEALDRRKSGNFSHIRLGGTVGFAIMSILFGLIASKHIDLLFVVYAGLLVISFLLVTRFPRIEGHQSQGRTMRIWVLLRNRRLMLYLTFNFLIQISLGYYYSFFPLYFKEMGGAPSWLGWSMVISSLSEVPFLLLSRRIFARIPVPFILLGAGAAAALRWYFFSVIGNPYWTLPVQVLHGAIFIVLSVTMATVINREVPNELKASGQTLNGLLSLGAARIIGSFSGGLASEAFGMRRVFSFHFGLSLLCVAGFAVLFLLQHRREQSTAETGTL
ncbi:MFS transporter [Paenibacillus aurantius]